MTSSYTDNTLEYRESRCIGCGLCLLVCPHGVFAENGDKVRVVRRSACMECGACRRNCPTGAIEVASGVGCATALFYAALTGREACCGTRGEEGRGAGDGRCCGSGEKADRTAVDGARCGSCGEVASGFVGETRHGSRDEPCRGGGGCCKEDG